MIGDISQLVGDLVGLLKAGEVDAAARRIEEARRADSAATFDVRQITVNALARALHQAQRQRERLAAIVATLPENERAFAKVQVEEICSMLLDDKIASLRAEKRRLSRPGGEGSFFSHAESQ
jgi:hypothetical protein